MSKQKLIILLTTDYPPAFLELIGKGYISFTINKTVLMAEVEEVIVREESQ